MVSMRKISGPVARPLRNALHGQSRFLEDLIHAVKNEIVDKLDGLTQKVDDNDQATKERLAFQTKELIAIKDDLRLLRQELSTADRSVTTDGIHEHP